MRAESRSLTSGVEPWKAIDQGAVKALAMTLGAAGTAGVPGPDGVPAMFAAPAALFGLSDPFPHPARVSTVMHVAAHATAAISTRFGMSLLRVAIQAEL
jgi:hypothetical protein